MRTHRAVGWGLTLLLVAAAACNDDAAGPGANENELSADEVQFLAVETDRMLDGILGDAFSAQGAAANASISSNEPVPLVPVTTTFSFERTRPCPVDGEIVVTGEGEFTVDHQAGSAKMEVAGDKTVTNCAFERREIIFTIDGEAEWDAYWEVVDHELLAAERNVEGTFSITTSDGRSAQCRFEVHAEYNQETGRVIVRGLFCETSVDQDWTRG
jgi:hypothetical protein